MKLHVEFTATSVRHGVRAISDAVDVVVVIDTLRATTTIVTALAAGAREIIPVTTPDEARNVYAQRESTTTLLCGELDGRKISGFDLGNSPLEYTPDVVRDKTIVLSTTNGTVALTASQSSRNVWCGCLNNVQAVSNELCKNNFSTVLLLCAGTHGRFSMEDSITSGAIVNSVRRMDPSHTETDDAAAAAETLFNESADDIQATVEESDHGQYLAAIGHLDDVRVCAELNSQDIVPVFANRSIRLR